MLLHISVSLFNGISTLIDYLKPKQFLLKNNKILANQTNFSSLEQRSVKFFPPKKCKFTEECTTYMEKHILEKKTFKNELNMALPQARVKKTRHTMETHRLSIKEYVLGTAVRIYHAKSLKTSSCHTANTDLPDPFLPSVYHPSLPVGLQGYIPYQHRAVVYRF